MQQPSKEIFDPNYYKTLQGEAAVSERLAGRLPLINVAGHLHFVEVRYGLLRPMDNFSSCGINIDKGAFPSEDESHRFFYYHKGRMEDIDPELMPVCDKMALVRVPSLLAMDPVMTAICQGLEFNTYLNEYPMIMYREAEVLHLNRDMIHMLAGRSDLREWPEKLFAMGREKIRSLLGKRKGKGL